MARLGRAFALVALLIASSQASAEDALPRPDPPFGCHIGRTVKDSTPDFPEEVHAPKGAPNVLLIMTDDVGFGASSTFGGPVPPPTMDRLAKQGLRYTQFHTTALCSPTRAALLSGRNHHSDCQCKRDRRTHGSPNHGTPSGKWNRQEVGAPIIPGRPRNGTRVTRISTECGRLACRFSGSRSAASTPTEPIVGSAVRTEVMQQRQGGFGPAISP